MFRNTGLSVLPKSPLKFIANNGNEFVFHDVYSVYADWMLEQISEAERAAVITQFKCCLFEDLDISLNDIFYDILP